MPKKRLYIVLGILVLLALVFSAAILQRQSSNLKALQAFALDFCGKESVKIDGKELRLQAKDFVKLTDSMKERYGIKDIQGEKTLLLEVATIETETQTEMPHTNPLILKASLQDGKWILDEQAARDELLQKLLLQDFAKEYVHARNKELDGSYSISSLYDDKRLESIDIKSNDTYTISYKNTASGDKNLYEFTKTIKNN